MQAVPDAKDRRRPSEETEQEPGWSSRWHRRWHAHDNTTKATPVATESAQTSVPTQASELLTYDNTALGGQASGKDATRRERIESEVSFEAVYRLSTSNACALFLSKGYRVR